MCRRTIVQNVPFQLQWELMVHVWCRGKIFIILIAEGTKTFHSYCRGRNAIPVSVEKNVGEPEGTTC